MRSVENSERIGERGRAASARIKSLAAIVAHPLRAKCWVILAERPASPVELSRLFEVPVSKVSYHVRELRDAGVIELCKTEPRRGSMEHWYRAVERPLLDDEATEARTVQQRNEMARFIFQREFADAALSLDDGVFGERHDHWVTRFPLNVDEDGWRELHAAYSELMDRIGDIEAASAQRLAERNGGAEGAIPVSAFAAYFEMPAR